LGAGGRLLECGINLVQPVLGAAFILFSRSGVRRLFEGGAYLRLYGNSLQSEPMQFMDRGFQFFANWYTRFSKLKDFKPESSREKRFLSWQTFDTLRLDYYGYKALVEQFVRLHPNYYILPNRITGSPIESLFSELRYRSSGQLTAPMFSPTLKMIASGKATYYGKRKSRRDFDYTNQTLHLNPAASSSKNP
jgi:hypothetical protein